MQIEVLESGLAVSIQDLGRIGFYRYGIPMGGAMDRESLKIANLLVGNEETAACFEAPFLGPKLRFKDHRQIAVTGGEVSVKVDSTEFRSWESITVEAGSVVEFGFIESGARLYISVSGGLNVPIVLNSRSTYTVGALGGFKGRMLQAGDLIPLTEAPIQVKEKNRRLPSDFVRNIDDKTDIRVLPGLYWHRLTQESGESFFKDTWTVATEADRMGYRFGGGNKIDFVERKQPFGAGSDPWNIVDSAYPYGSIQIPGGTEPIVLHRDAVSGGGYFQVGAVISSDMDIIGQLQPNKEVNFVKVTMEEALAARKNKNARMDEIRQILL